MWVRLPVSNGTVCYLENNAIVYTCQNINNPVHGSARNQYACMCWDIRVYLGLLGKIKRNAATGCFILILYLLKKRIKIRKLEIEFNKKCCCCWRVSFSNTLLIICGVNQRPVRKFNIRSVFCVFSLPLCCITYSDNDSSRRHPNYD